MLMLWYKRFSPLSLPGASLRLPCAPMARVHPKETRSSSNSDVCPPRVPPPETSPPPAPENSEPAAKVGDVDSSESMPILRGVKMCLPTACSTLIASIISSVLMFVGLVAFGLAEGQDLARPSWLTLLCRFAGWIFLFVLPTLGIAGPPLRDFVVWGLEPGLCCTATQNSEGSRCLARYPAAWMQQILVWIIYAMLTILPIHEGQPLGCFMVFIFGNLLSSPSGAFLVKLFGPSCVCFRYARSVAPTCHFLPIIGFGILVSSYLALRHAAGVWFGIFMPLLLTAYEYLGLGVLYFNTFSVLGSYFCYLLPKK